MKKKILSLGLAMVILSSCSMGNSGSVTLTGQEYQEYLEKKEKIDKIDYLISEIEENYLYEDKINMEDLEVGLYKGLFAALEDPYSVYYSKDEFTKLNEDNQGEFGGVGIQISAQADDFITVVAPIKGTPAEAAGIKPGDKIIAINGEPYFGTDLEKAVSIMRGEPGTDVDLTIRREKDQGFEDKDFTITREIIKVDSVHPDTIGDFAYIRLSSFDEHTYEDFKKAVDEAQKTNPGLVLDLRNNPGGLLSSVVSIADYLLPQGPIVSTVDNKGKKLSEESDEAMVDIPIVVLINQGSASASEILAGALQDYHRATIVGQTSFGKGVVQKIYPLKDGGYKITVSEYYTALGNEINKEGVKPDVEVDLGEDTEGIGIDFYDQDSQLQKAVEVLTEEIKD